MVELYIILPYCNLGHPDKIVHAVEEICEILREVKLLVATACKGKIVDYALGVAAV